MIPSENWGGEGLLGLQVRYDAVDAPGAPDDGEDEEWALHVVSVDESSPAAQAGLVAMDDFILGSHDLAFADMAALSDYIYRCAGEEVILYLYRSSCDTVFTRLISIPESGVLGVELASGRLHALPNRETDGFSEDGGRVEGDSSSSAGAGAGLGAALESHNTSGIERRVMEEFLANGGSANTSLEHAPYSGSSSSSSSSSSGALAQQALFPCPEDQATGRCSMLPNCPYSHASAGAISSAYASSGAFPQSPAANRQAPQLLLPPQQQQQFQPQQQQTQQQPQPQQYQPQQQYFQPQPQQAPGAYSPAPGPAPWQPAPIRIPGAEQPPASQHPSAHTPSFTPGSAVPSSARSAATMLQPPPLPQFQQQYASPHPPLPRSPAPTSNYQARTPGLLPPPSPAFQGRG